MQKIDVFAHILPSTFVDALSKKIPETRVTTAMSARLRPGVRDLDIRFRIMDQNEGYVQILCMAEPPVEDIADSKVAVELAKIANEGMAELVTKYPDRFLTAVACLPMNNMEEAVKEIDRVIIDLGFRGIQITSNIMDKPLDSPEFEPLFERMNYYRLPILIHPRRMKSGPRAFGVDIKPLPNDKIGQLAQNFFNWPFETTIAMGRFVWSGMLEKYPNLKIITHHCGGFTPYQVTRITQLQGIGEIDMHRKPNSIWHFNKRPIDYYKMMYGDTAVWGNTSALMCGYDFFGPDHMLFGTDTAFGPEGGAYNVRETIRSVEMMTIHEEDKRKIFEDNARRLFQLPFHLPY
jgi:predicted TIM-barrel fold metal-dependent hydrolase